MGGMTEGDVYDALQDMYTWMMVRPGVPTRPGWPPEAAVR